MKKQWDHSRWKGAAGGGFPSRCKKRVNVHCSTWNFDSLPPWRQRENFPVITLSGLSFVTCFYFQGLDISFNVFYVELEDANRKDRMRN